MRCHAIVSGNVQGVGFRWFVRERARALGLAGRVRNRSDGTVEVEAEGDAPAITTLIDHLRAGPSAARVSGVELIPEIDSPNILPTPFTADR